MIYRFVLTNDIKGAYILPTDPNGWDDIEFSIERGLEYHGLFYEQNVKLDFYCSAGKEFIDTIYEEIGIDAVIEIKIFMTCNCNPPKDAPDYTIDYSDDYGSLVDDICEWDLVYEGKLDLATLELLDNNTKVSIIQSDFFTKIRNRLDTKIDVTKTKSVDNEVITNINSYEFTMHNYPLVLKSEWEYLGVGREEYEINTAITWNLNHFSWCLPFILKVDNSNELAGQNISGLGLVNGADSVILGDRNTPVSIGARDDGSIDSSLRGNASNNGGLYPFSNFLFDNTTDLPITITYNLVLKFKQQVNTNAYIDGSTLDDFIQYRIQEYIGFVQRDPYNDPIEFPPFSPSYNKPANVQVLFASNYACLEGDVFTNIIVDLNVTRSVVVPPSNRFNIVANLEDFSIDRRVTNSTFYIEAIDVEQWSLDITYTSIFEETTANVYNIHEVGDQITKGITSNNSGFKSEVLGLKTNGYADNGCNGFSVLSTGFGLRGFPTNEKTLSMSMSDYYNSLNAMLCLGLGIEKNIDDEYILRVEKREHFYDKTVMLTLNNVPDIRRSIANDYIFNQIFIGYENYSITDFTGLDELNSQREYSTGVYNSINQINAISQFTTGQYSIELVRRKNYNTFTYLDTEWDEQIFLIGTNRGVDISGNPTGLTIAEKSENFNSISNIINYQYAYNLRYSPTRNLLRWLNFLSGSIIGNADKFLSFQKGYANYTGQSLQTDICIGNFDNNLLAENQDISRAEVLAIADSIFIPEYIDFDFPLSFAQFKTIRDTPTYSIEINNGYGTTYRGFVISVKYKPTKGVASFRLLRQYI